MKITFAVPHSGCAYWRARQPAKMIEKLGLAEVRIFEDMEMPSEQVEDWFKWSDVIVQQSSMGITALASVIKLKDLGHTVVGDYDDLSFSLPPWNPAYKTLGLKEVKIMSEGLETYIYKDGVGGFDLKANYFRYKSLQDLLKTYSAVTTTTKFIKDIYSKSADNVYILPNSIDFGLFKPFPRKPTKQVRIGWTASDSHHAEVWMVKRIIRSIFNKYGDSVRFVLLGNIDGIPQEFKNDSYERHDFIGLDTYPLKLASLNLDVAICPLDDIEFNRAKSALKWSEMSSMRVPCVCTNLEPYHCVRDGETGMLAKDEDEFFIKLCALIDDSVLRKKIAQNAFDQNYDDFNLEKNAILWVEAYEQARESCELPLLDREALESVIPRI